MRLLFLESRVRGEAAARQPRNSKQALAMRQKLIEFPAQIPPFLERERGRRFNRIQRPRALPWAIILWRLQRHSGRATIHQ
jgi:hypothetical protein